MGTLRKYAGPVIGIAIFIAALVVLQSALHRYHYRDIMRELHSLPRGRILLALLFTAGSYLALTGYDSLGLRYIRRPLRYGRIAFASFVAYAFSHNLGFPLLTGAPVRFRLYSSWGLSAVEVTNVIAFNSLTFFMGLFTVGGVVFLVEPLQIPGLLHLPFGSVRPVGAIFLAISLGYLVWSGVRNEPLRLGGLEFFGIAGRVLLDDLLPLLLFPLRLASLAEAGRQAGPPLAHGAGDCREQVAEREAGGQDERQQQQRQDDDDRAGRGGHPRPGAA